MEMNVILGKNRADGTMTFALDIEGKCVQFDGKRCRQFLETYRGGCEGSLRSLLSSAKI